MFELENRGELVEKIEDLVNRKRYTELRDLLLPMEPADIAIFLAYYNQVGNDNRIVPVGKATTGIWIAAAE